MKCLRGATDPRRCVFGAVACSPVAPRPRHAFQASSRFARRLVFPLSAAVVPFPSPVGAAHNTSSEGAPRWAPWSGCVVCLPSAGAGSCKCSGIRRFGATVVQASGASARRGRRFPQRGFGLHGTFGGGGARSRVATRVHYVGSRRRLGFCGLPGASRADFVLVRVVPPPLLRRVRGGFARHGGDTRPRRVPWRHATRTRRNKRMFACRNSVRSRLLHVEFVRIRFGADLARACLN